MPAVGKNAAITLAGVHGPPLGVVVRVGVAVAEVVDGVGDDVTLAGGESLGVGVGVSLALGGAVTVTVAVAVGADVTVTVWFGTLHCTENVVVVAPTSKDGDAVQDAVDVVSSA